jgi:hypothetical protein
MPRWLQAFIIILLLVVFILPDPVGAGTTVGNAIDSLIIFFRSFSTALMT